MLKQTHQLYDYHVWANERLFEHLEQLPKDVFHAEVTSVFPSVSQTFEHPKYGSLNTRFSEILQHVVNHGTYHRGNVTAMLRQQGYAGFPTDYLFYLLNQQESQK